MQKERIRPDCLRCNGTAAADCVLCSQHFIKEPFLSLGDTNASDEGQYEWMNVLLFCMTPSLCGERAAQREEKLSAMAKSDTNAELCLFWTRGERFMKQSHFVIFCWVKGPFFAITASLLFWWICYEMCAGTWELTLHFSNLVKSVSSGN